MTDASRPVVVLDNGAHTIKCGLSTSEDEPRIIPNSVVRLKGEKNRQFIGGEFDETLDYSIVNYRHPFERGYLTDWDVEKAIWDKTFLGKKWLHIDPREHSLLVTEPNFNLHHIQETYDQMVFEEWEFASYYRCPAAAVTPFDDLFAPQGQGQPECAVIIDSGFSFTHVTPVLQSSSEPIIPALIQWPSVRRLDVGGKLLTNHLKELVSFRHWDMTESTHVINQVKERCCFVSRNFARDLEICRSDLKSNPIAQSYVLPSFASEPPRPGYIITPSSPPHEESDTVLPMNNERFVIPEVLFQPSDVGIAQVGLIETVTTAIESLPEEMRGVAWANIGLVGGNCLFEGFQERLFDGLRAHAPSDYEVCLYRAKNPITYAYHAAHNLATSPIFPSLCVTRAEYLERGTSACRRKFANVSWCPGGDSDATSERREAGAGRKDRKGSLLGKEAGRRRNKSEATAATVGEDTTVMETSTSTSVAPKRGRKSTVS